MFNPLQTKFFELAADNDWNLLRIRRKIRSSVLRVELILEPSKI